jgi:trans-aconitate 2-methyltransferase
MQSFAWNAREYEKHSSQQQLWARELIAKLGLKNDDRVLDIGCGDGKVTAEIAALVREGSVLGVDNSADMIALAQQRYPPRDFPNLLFRQEDARDLPFWEEFSVVFSNAALHWVRDHRPVLHGISRSLQHGGKALLQMGGKGNAADVLAVSDGVTASSKWSSYFAGFSLPYGFHSPDDYDGWLRAAGLTPLRVELFARDMVHQGRTGFAGWLRTTHMLPYLALLPESEREAFIAQMVDAYLAMHPIDEQGNVHIHMVRLEVEAVKP